MNKICLFLIGMMITSCAIFKKKKSSTSTDHVHTTETSYPSTTDQNLSNTSTQNQSTDEVIRKDAINWLTWAQAEAAMAKNPKPVFVDVYTDWCGWCKVMDKKTFTNKKLIEYLNTHFYAIKFNSEKEAVVNLKGKTYRMIDGTNQLAVDLMGGNLAYPTTILMEKNFKNPRPIPGYLKPQDLEPILNYHVLNDPNVNFIQYKNEYKVTW